MKKYIAFLLAVMLLASLSATAFAADGDNPGKIIIDKTNSNHTYLAYEIFAGEIVDGKDEAGNPTGLKQINNVRWGCDITDAGILALCGKYLTSDQYSTTPGGTIGYNTATVAALVAGKLKAANTAQAREFAAFLTSDASNLITEEAASQGNNRNNNMHTITFPAGGNPAELAVHHQGYFLVIDKAGSLRGVTDSSYTNYILVVVSDSNVTIEHKNDVPVMIKKVQENTNIDASAGTTDSRLSDHTLSSNYNDTADYSIGDEIPYELISNLPSNLIDYSTYNLVFHDDMNGMQYVANSLEVYVRNTNDTVKLASNGAFTHNVSGDKKKITVSLNMTRTDGAFALPKDGGGTTTVNAGSYIIVKYKAALDATAVLGMNGNPNEAYLEYSNNPTKADDRGTTTKDKNIVYTYELDILKQNAEEKKPLKGAKFKVQKTVSGGSTADPAGYAILEEVKGEVPPDAPSGTVPAVLGYRVAGWSSSGTEVETGDDGYIHIFGLDRGHYFLTETAAPANYSLLEKPIEIAIDANIGNTQSWAGNDTTLTKLSISITDPNLISAPINGGTGDTKNGAVGINIANNATAQLPTTGGIGTTMFYAIGAALALGAAVILVAKRRVGVGE